MDGKPGRRAKPELRHDEHRVAGGGQHPVSSEVDDRNVYAVAGADQDLGTWVPEPWIDQGSKDIRRDLADGRQFEHVNTSVEKGHCQRGNSPDELARTLSSAGMTQVRCKGWQMDLSASREAPLAAFCCGTAYRDWRADAFARGGQLYGACRVVDVASATAPYAACSGASPVRVTCARWTKPGANLADQRPGRW